MQMKSQFSKMLIATSFLVFGTQAVQAGCLKGAVVGGIAGHYAGKHAVAGALAGCAIGHHMAKKAKNNKPSS